MKATTTLSCKEMSMTVHVNVLTEDDARNNRFENIARSTKLRQGRG